MAGINRGLALLLLVGLLGCKAKPPPDALVSTPPPVYTGDRRGDGGLLNGQRPGTSPAPASSPGSGGVQVGNLDANMTLGNPDGATTDASNKEHYLLTRKQYDLSYNDEKRFPNWVAWKLEAEDIGSQPRGQFAPDPELPDGFTRVTPSFYTGSGYDRGHNCPAKDRSANKEDNDAVFYMTNMTPQLHAMNAGPWERLESYTRTLVQQRDMTCYVVCGHAGRELGRTRGGVAVPEYGWKVVVAVPKGQAVDASARVIAVKMPNDGSIRETDPWEQFLTTVSALEGELNMPLLNGLPPDVQTALRDKKDQGGGSFGGESGTQKRRRRSSGSFGR
ncbi:MAG: DNA/RNA non-specific endonuclease [Armatimonas sp.]